MSKDSDRKSISETASSWVARRDAGMSGPETAEFERWLAADARHGVAFERFARAWAALDRPLSAGEQGALVHELRARALRRNARRHRARRVQAAAAAACAAVILVFVALWQRSREVAGPQPSGAPAAGVVAANSDRPAFVQPRQGVAKVTSPEQRLLDDGSTAELRPGAVIDVRYDDAARRVVLVSGEAHFRVAKNISRPFVVVAGGMEVRAVGTAFSVGLGAEQMEVWVTEGRVAVEKPAAPPDTEKGDTITTPAAHTDGEEALAPEGDEPVLVATLGMSERVVVETAPCAPAPVVETVTSDEINKRMAWRISRLEFSTTPLAEAVALINRYSQLPDGSTNVRLVLDESLSGLAAEPVSGYFHANDIATFVDVLNVSMGIESERHGDVIVLRIRRE